MTSQDDSNMQKFAGTYRLDLWDCGRQGAYFQTFVSSRRAEMFWNVRMLIFAFSIDKKMGIQHDMYQFKETV